jgi:hypothetical protein
MFDNRNPKRISKGNSEKAGPLQSRGMEGKKFGKIPPYRSIPKNGRAAARHWRNCREKTEKAMARKRTEEAQAGKTEGRKE